MRSLVTLLTVALGISLSTLAHAQDASVSAKLDAIEKSVDARRAELHIPGVSLAIVKDGKVVYLKGLGERNVEEHLPVTPDTLFAIGSTTKAFTATTMMMSVEEGKLALSDSPKKYLPLFKLRDPDSDKKITLSDLLCHRSGLARTDLAWYTGKLTPEEVIRVAGEAKPTAKIGEKFQYQNVMFLAAGMVVGKVHNTTWKRFVTDRILKPLKMNRTNLSAPAMLARDDHAIGYNWNEGEKRYDRLALRDIRCIDPAGAINSCARDMAQWVRLLLGSGAVDGKRYVSEKSFAEMTSPHQKIAGAVDYGYGWMLRDWNGHRVVEHGGNIDGFNAQVALMPDAHVGFVLLTNVSASSLGSETMRFVWENLVGAPTREAAAPAGTPTAPEKEIGVYLLKQANLRLTVSFAENRLSLLIPGQPKLPLEPLGGRRYRAGAPAQDGVFITFRTGSAGEEMYLEQPGAKLTLPKEVVAPFTAALTVDELMARAIEAEGGEANLRKHRTLWLRGAWVMDEQAVSGETIAAYDASGRFATMDTLFAAGKRIGTTRDCTDGVTGFSEASFIRAAPMSAEEVQNALHQIELLNDLEWKKRFKSVTIRGLGKVDGEEVYEVEKKPEHGAPVIDSYSTKSFLLRKRQIGPAFTIYSDYKPVDGVMIAHKRTVTNGLEQDAHQTVTAAKFDVTLPASLFARPAGVVSARLAPESVWQ